MGFLKQKLYSCEEAKDMNSHHSVSAMSCNIIIFHELLDKKNFSSTIAILGVCVCVCVEGGGVTHHRPTGPIIQGKVW